MRLIFVRITTVLALGVFGMIGCTSDNEEELFDDPDCSVLDVSYSEDIISVFQSYGCIGCHGSSSPSGNVVLDTYDGVKTVADNGKLESSVSWDGNAANMPPGGSQIDECSINKISAWVEAGATNN